MKASRAAARRPVAWTIAGTDPTGGAGIPADLRVFHGLGVHGGSVITAVLAQNAHAVSAVSLLSASMVRAQLDALAGELPPAAVKLGMLARAATVRAVADALAEIDAPVVCDPVLAASSGRALLDGAGIRALRERLLPRVDLLTPNRPEAARLTGQPVRTADEAAEAAARLLADGARAVLVKGGHAGGRWSQDLLAFPGAPACWVIGPRLDAPHARGTGCTLSAAIAAVRAHGLDLPDAVVLGRAYLHRALRLGGPFGRGPGALHHGGWPDEPGDLPWIVQAPGPARLPPPFPDCPPDRLAHCARTAHPDTAARLLGRGVRLVWLHPGNAEGASAEAALARAAAAARRTGGWLFVESDVAAAVHNGAQGVCMDAAGLVGREVAAARRAGLRLGVRFAGYADLARARSVRPSFVVLDPHRAGVDPAAFARLQRLAPAPLLAATTPAAAPRFHAAGAAGIVASPDAGPPPVAASRLEAWLAAFEEIP